MQVQIRFRIKYSELHKPALPIIGLIFIFASPESLLGQIAFKPPYTEIMLTRERLQGKSNGEGVCASIPPEDWTSIVFDGHNIMVNTQGPEGSGRYWTITIGIAPDPEAVPKIGYCLTTTTVGWRTLQGFKRGLEWLEDRDGDKKPELIIWDSFPLREDASMAEFGIIAWVYQLDKASKFTFDMNLSRQLAREIAASYREPLKKSDELIQRLRNKAASMLEGFAKSK